jgi:tRNA(Ile)-lysidine synthase
VANQPFDNLPIAVQRRVVHCQLIRFGAAPDFELVEKLRLSPEKTVNAPMLNKQACSNSVSRASSGELRLLSSPKAEFASASQSINLTGNTGSFRFDGITVRWQKLTQNGAQWLPSNSTTECFDADKLGSHIQLRHWRKGDRFWPIGMKNTVKLQDLLTNAKIPRLQRHNLAIGVAETGEIFWVEGLRISESFKLKDATRSRLEWEWVRSTPRCKVAEG